MSVLLLAQIVAALSLGSLALTLLRRGIEVRARRAAAFEDFAAGRNLDPFRGTA